MTISVENWEDHSVLHHSLVVLKGQCTSVDNGSLLVSVNEQESSTWAIRQGLFCALVSLKTGVNNISLCSRAEELSLTLTLEHLNRKRIVGLVYIICSDSDGCFQGPSEEDCSVQSAKSRIVFGARLIQSLTAEKIGQLGIPPRTFSLEEDDNGQIVCHIFRTKLTTAETHAKNEKELWEHFALELMNSKLGDDCRKFLAFLSSTRYLGLTVAPKSFSEVRSQTLGHVALGGGGLALLGTACLYTWANSLSEFQKRMEDCRPVDFTRYMDDSCNRGTLWSCYASTLGAALHELGHTLDQGHTEKGIMGLGFHQLQRELTPHPERKCCVCSRNAEIDRMGFVRLEVVRPTNKDTNSFPPNPRSVQWRKPCPHCPDGAFWSASAALLLYYHRWMLTEESQDDLTEQVLSKGWLVKSNHGLAVLEVRDEQGLVLCFWHPGKSLCPRALQVLKRTLPPNACTLLVRDTQGATLSIPLSSSTPSIGALK